MKYILTISLLLFSVAFHGQEIYQDKDKGNYLFIGSISDSWIKVWNMDKKEIDWIDMASGEIEQVGRLQAKAYLSKVFEAGLSFFVEGEEPFWAAKINSDSIIFTAPDEEYVSSHKINIAVNDFIDSSFSFMFKSEDNNIYGLVRGHTYFPKDQDICEFCNNDELSLLEVFVNYKGSVYKGCARLEDNSLN